MSMLSSQNNLDYYKFAGLFSFAYLSIGLLQFMFLLSIYLRNASKDESRGVLYSSFISLCAFPLNLFLWPLIIMLDALDGLNATPLLFNSNYNKPIMLDNNFTGNIIGFLFHFDMVDNELNNDINKKEKNYYLCKV